MTGITWPNPDLPPVNLYSAPDHGALPMKSPTLTEIRKAVEAKGGTYKKLKATLNGQALYEVNGRLLSTEGMIASYKLGVLL
jgi:hypothetical protein